MNEINQLITNNTEILGPTLLIALLVFCRVIGKKFYEVPPLEKENQAKKA